MKIFKISNKMHTQCNNAHIWKTHPKNQEKYITALAKGPQLADILNSSSVCGIHSAQYFIGPDHLTVLLAYGISHKHSLIIC